ncbi:BTAD domain-containing putative transcriptional regulator [Nocardia alni]|uniref:BTAD domain-containing putative transcriptional regulator n=1 Tax=Nocardia alni TaxID=2815723 RepID=UPI0020B3266C|nr:BTAD domain-containing putative transcriptional regulator [Nocardia alni]
MVLIRVLGSFAAEAGGAPVPLGGPRQRGVLALLVAARGQVVPVDRMVEDLWRGEPPSRALTSLQAYVSNLRRLLEPGRPPRTPARLLVSAAPGYALRLPPDAVDAWRFEGLLAEARTDPGNARARLDEALALWRGPAFAEVADEPWAAAETARLNELHLVARELHIAAGLRLGAAATVVPEAAALTRDTPLREEGWRLHALALWSAGRQADALATLRRARTTFADELGLDPGPELVALEEAILNQRTDILRTAVPTISHTKAPADHRAKIPADTASSTGPHTTIPIDQHATSPAVSRTTASADPTANQDAAVPAEHATTPANPNTTAAPRRGATTPIDPHVAASANQGATTPADPYTTIPIDQHAAAPALPRTATSTDQAIIPTAPGATIPADPRATIPAGQGMTIPVDPHTATSTHQDATGPVSPAGILHPQATTPSSPPDISSAATFAERSPDAAMLVGHSSNTPTVAEQNPDVATSVGHSPSATTFAGQSHGATTFLTHSLSATTFVGRDSEIAALLGAAGAAVADGARVALVTGEAGLGKSTLLEHLAARLGQDGWLVAAGRCPEVDSAPPAWAWVETLRTVAASVSTGQFAADLAPLLSDTVPMNGDAAAGRFRLRQAVWNWLAAVAADRPVAVVLDDLHWADAATLELLGGVDIRAPILVVAAYRADESERLTETLGSLARTAPLRLNLPGLQAGAVARLVRAECETDDATVARIAERTGGNPFYVRESARLLSSEGALVALSQVPEGVRDVLRRRLARLPESGVSILRLAAVAGRESSVDVLVRAADSDEDSVLDALDAGVIAGLLDEPGQGRVRFVHALVRDTLVADVSRLRTTRMHARIAAALEGTGDVAALAYHYARAGSPKAVAYCVRAAEQAEARYAHDVAAALLTDAVANSGDPDERAELLGRLLRAQIRAGAVAAARDTRERAVEYAESIGRDDLMIAAFTAWTEPTPWQARTYGTVDRPIVGRLRRLLERTDLAADVRCHLLVAYANELVGEDDPTVTTAAREALDLAADPRLRAAALLILSRDPRQKEYSRQLRAIGVEHDLPAYRVTALFNLAANAAVTNDPATMRRLTEEALDLARAYRMPEAVGAAEIALATLVLIEGRHTDAERLYIEATERMERAGSVHAAGFLHLALAAIWLNDGTLGDHLDDVRAFHEELGPLLADLLTLALHAAGRADEAHRSHTSPSPIRHDFFFTFLTSLRAMAIVALGDRDTAEEIYADLLPYHDGPPAGAESMSLAVPPVAHTLGELALLLGRDEQAAAHFTDAAAIADRWNAPHWSADARAHRNLPAPRDRER